MNSILEYLQLTSFHPRDLLVVVSLVILEGLLSCDNAVALALLVRDLPRYQQPKALRYGIIGAYIFRIAAILLATYIIRLWYLKIAGGLYLVWIAGQHFFGKKEESEDVSESKVPQSRVVQSLGLFWGTVVLVELTDIAFSVDSIAASVALSNKIWVLIAGGLLGILAMRFAAQAFIRLLQKFPALEGAAFAAVAFIGLKLLMEFPLDVLGRSAEFPPESPYTTAAEYEALVHKHVPHVVEVPHMFVIHGAAAPSPTKEKFVNHEEFLRAEAFWVLQARPVAHIDSLFSSAIVMAMFGVGFIRKKDEEDEKKASTEAPRVITITAEGSDVPAPTPPEPMKQSGESGTTSPTLRPPAVNAAPTLRPPPVVPNDEESLQPNKAVA